MLLFPVRDARQCHAYSHTRLVFGGGQRPESARGRRLNNMLDWQYPGVSGASLDARIVGPVATPGVFPRQVASSCTFNDVSGDIGVDITTHYYAQAPALEH